MPLPNTPDGSGIDVNICKGYCKQEGQEKLYCGAGCRNVKKLTLKQQKEIKDIEDKLYFISNLDMREYYKKSIEEIINPSQNRNNLNKLKDIEKYI